MINYLFRISVEVEIYHHLPRYFSTDCTSQSEDLTSHEPPGQTDSVDRLVVGWYGDVDVSHGCVRVAESNDWDVYIRGLSNSLMIGTWVSNDQQTRLTEVLL